MAWQQQSRSTEPSSIRLPYLRKNKLMPYPRQPQYSSPLPRPKKEFNLSTNHCSLPPYDPQHDANLVYFFEKPTNRKIMDEIGQAEKAKSQRRSPRTQRKAKAEAGSRVGPALSQAQLSKEDFNEYIQKMKSKLERTRAVSGAEA